MRARTAGRVQAAGGFPAPGPGRPAGARGAGVFWAPAERAFHAAAWPGGAPAPGPSRSPSPDRDEGLLDFALARGAGRGAQAPARASAGGPGAVPARAVLAPAREDVTPPRGLF